MTAIRDVLLAPDVGWRRYDDTHPGFKFTGSWTTFTGGYGTGSSYRRSFVIGDKVWFRFKGHSLRIIAPLNYDLSERMIISIDGVSEEYSIRNASLVWDALVYEKTGLDDAVHTVEITCGQSAINIVDAIDINRDGYLISAMIGTSLTAPEPSWRRIGNRENGFKFLGSGWTHLSDPNSYGGTMTYTQTVSTSPQLEFTFVGTKLRYIGNTYTTHSANVVIIIDGVQESFSQRGANVFQCLEYEKLNLPYGKHKVQIYSTQSYGPRLEAIDIDEDGYFVTYGIGEQLTKPEPGWKRYDDTHPTIIYKGSWSKDISNPAHYHTSENLSTALGSNAVIRFKGTRFRLFGSHWSTCSNDIDVYVDGIFHEKISQLGSSIRTALSYQIENLEDAIHEITFVNNKTTHLSVDAIDIDANGRLLHPDEVLDPSELKVGKRIRCHYQAGMANEAGSFSNLGKETYVDGINDFIPVTSPTLPNGDFYFIMVEDRNGKKRLVADRNVQSTISWDALNAAGYITGRLNSKPKMFSSPKNIATSNTAFWSAPRANRPFFVSFRALIRGGRYFISSGSQTSSQGFAIGIDGGAPFASVRTDKYYIGISGLIFEYNVWADYTFVWNGYGIEWHINGVPRQTQNVFLGSSYGNDMPLLTVMRPNNNDSSSYYGDADITDIRFCEGVPGNEIPSAEADLINTAFYEGIIHDYDGDAFLRLLTAGVTVTDTDSEWDKYIVDSDLNGTITAGDNSVWNWSTQWSWTSTTPTSNIQTRVIIGYSTIRRYDTPLTTHADGYGGFRPLLELDIKEIIVIPPRRKYLVEENGVIKTYDVVSATQMTKIGQEGEFYHWSAPFDKDVIVLEVD